MRCSKCGRLVRLYVFTVAVIVTYYLFLVAVYGSDRGAVENDFMNLKVFDFPLLENCCSLWPISHFFFFLFVGLVFPDCDLMAIGGGILWELVEVGTYQVLRKDRQGVRVTSGSQVEYSDNWWAGSTKDIVFNILGFYLGKWIVSIRGRPLFIPCLCK